MKKIEEYTCGEHTYTITFQKIVSKEGFERHRILIDDELWYGKLTFSTFEKAVDFFNNNHPVDFDFKE